MGEARWRYVKQTGREKDQTPMSCRGRYGRYQGGYNVDIISCIPHIGTELSNRTENRVVVCFLHMVARSRIYHTDVTVSFFRHSTDPPLHYIIFPEPLPSTWMPIQASLSAYKRSAFDIEQDSKTEVEHTPPRRILTIGQDSKVRSEEMIPRYWMASFGGCGVDIFLYWFQSSFSVEVSEW